MRGLRFCMVTTFYPPYSFGGDAISVQRFSRALVQRGHHVTVIHDVDAFNSLHWGPEPTRPPADDGVEVVPLRSRLRVLSPLLTHQTGRPVVHGSTIRQVLEAGRFDVINFHNISLVGGPGVLSVGNGLKVYMAHEHWLVCPTHVLWRHGREICAGRECTRCVLHYTRPPQLWRYTGYLERQLEHVDLFLALSEFSRAKHYEFGFPREMEVLPNFLPEPPAGGVAAAGERPHERPYFLFVGRLERIKGLDDVLPAFERYPDADLLIAGEGSHAPVLKRLAAENPRVRFLGRLEPEELPRYYAHAIAVLIPSVCLESFPLVLIEAFRNATPVIARRVGPMPEIVAWVRGSELFATPTELLAAMRRLQHNGELRQKLGQAGYEMFLQRWSERAVVPRYLELVRQAGERKGLAHIAAALGAHPALTAVT